MKKCICCGCEHKVEELLPDYICSKCRLDQLCEECDKNNKEVLHRVILGFMKKVRVIYITKLFNKIKT